MCPEATTLDMKDHNKPSVGKKTYVHDFLHTGANDLKNVKDPSNVELAKITNNNEIEVVISFLIPRGTDSQETFEGIIYYLLSIYYLQGQEWTNFFPGTRLLRRATSCKLCTSDRDTTRNIAFCYLLTK